MIELSQEAAKLLTDIYKVLWIEAYYDRTSDSIQEFAKPLADKMMELNKELRFKA